VTRRRAAAAVYSVALAQGLVGAAFPASALVLRESGLGDVRYGSLFVPQMALAALGASSAGHVLRRLGARRGLALGTLLMGLSQAALALCPYVGPGWVYPVALVGTSLLGAGAGIAAGPLNAYPQVLFPSRSESAVVALHAVSSGGLALTPLLVGQAVEARVWLVFPLLLLAFHFVVRRGVKRAPLPEAEPLREGDVSRPLDSRALWVFVSIAFLYGLTECIFGNWAVVFLSEDRHLGAAMAGAGSAAFWAALGAGRVAVAALLFRVRPAPVLPALAGLMACGCLLMPLVRSPGSAIALFALGGLGCSAVLPLTLGLGGRRFPEHRAWVAGALYAALVSGLGMGSFTAGLLRPILGLASVYRLAAVPPALACVLAVALARRASRSAAAIAAPATAEGAIGGTGPVAR
jgi:FHS family glucose/mannose:H+ symporter-like MFS transporter